MHKHLSVKFVDVTIMAENSVTKKKPIGFREWLLKTLLIIGTGIRSQIKKEKNQKEPEKNRAEKEKEPKSGYFFDKKLTKRNKDVDYGIQISTNYHNNIPC